MATREGEGRQKEREIAETREQLAAAEAKIQVGSCLLQDVYNACTLQLVNCVTCRLWV